jgi:hypothetical protein
MDKTQSITYLTAFGEELARRGFTKVRILAVGGFYMLQEIENRPATEDIDFVSLDGDIDLTRKPLSQKEKAFRTAIWEVAKQYKLKRAWMNDDAGPFVLEYVPQPAITLWRTFGPLHVYLTDHETMLVYKIMGYSPKQKRDIDALCEELGISTYAEVKAIVDRLVPQQTQGDFWVDETLEDLFVE